MATQDRTNWWPLRRRKQVRQMERLLRDLSQLNNGGLFLDKTKDCIKRAKKLLKTDYSSGNVSFVQYLDNKMFGD